MSNFPALTASATQKNLISIDLEHCSFTVLFAMPTMVELSQFTGVGGCMWPISSRVSQNIVACLQFKIMHQVLPLQRMQQQTVILHTRLKKNHSI